MVEVRWRFWIETLIGGVTTLLFLVTLLWRDWLELVFGIDPDARSGAVEWLVVTLAAVLTIACITLARLEWRRARALARAS